MACMYFSREATFHSRVSVLNECARRATAQVRNSFPVRCIVAGIHVRTAEIGYLVVLVAGTAKRIYQGGEESDAAFFVYFADTVRLQQLVNASAFFVCQVVSGDVLYVEADGLL